MDQASRILPPSPEPTSDFQLESLLSGKCDLFFDLELPSTFDDLLTPVSSPDSAEESRYITQETALAETPASSGEVCGQDDVGEGTKKRRRKKGTVARQVSVTKRRTYKRKSSDLRKSWLNRTKPVQKVPKAMVEECMYPSQSDFSDLEPFALHPEEQLRVTIADSSRSDEVIELTIPVHGDDDERSSDIDVMMADISSSLVQNQNSSSSRVKLKRRRDDGRSKQDVHSSPEELENLKHVMDAVLLENAALKKQNEKLLAKVEDMEKLLNMAPNLYTS